MKILLPILLLIAGGVFYYLSYYPPVVLKGRTEGALQTFANSVELKDRDAVGAALDQLMTDDVQVKLDVHFFSITSSGNSGIVQDFDKGEFILFVDNVLYPLSDYGFMPQLETFVLTEDRQSAQITFTAKAWADGASLFGGVSVETRTSTDVSCQGTVRFTQTTTQLGKADCSLTLRTVPKPGQAEKIQNNADAMRDFLIQK
ncbi:MAG: hypothetical protein AB7L92_01855 [Alphaproteobacteria bacterium]